MSLSAIFGGLKAVFTAIGKALGLIEDAKLRKAGRNEAGIKQLKEQQDARDRMEAVRPTTDGQLSDRLRNHDF